MRVLRPRDASPLLHWSIQRACVCVCGVFGARAQQHNSPSAFIFVCVHAASVTLLHHCNRLHCSSLFRLSAHAWQFDCLSFPHRFPPIISALCVCVPPRIHSPAHPSHSPSYSLKTLCGWVCFVESCGKFTLEDWSSSCCSGNILMWKLLVLEQARCHKQADNPILFFSFFYFFI